MTRPRRSPLVQGFLFEAEQWRHQVGDDPLRAGLDPDRHGHSRRERDLLAVDLYRSAVERDMRGIDRLVARLLALSVFGLAVLPESVGGLR